MYFIISNKILIKKILIKITTETNLDTYYCYKKIFDNEYFLDKLYSYFSYDI